MGLGLLCWPDAGVRHRVVRLSAQRRPRARRLRPGRRRAVLAATSVAVVATTLLAGPLPAVALALLGGAAGWQWRTRDRARQRVALTAALAETLRTMVAELRAGAHPAVAAASASADAPPAVAGMLAAIAASARAGGDLDPALLVRRSPAVGEDVATQLARAWALAGQHGLPLASVLEAVHLDVEARARLSAQVRARMAGPRASAAILAALPVAGVALGETMGAGPAEVLLTQPSGQVLLVAGSLLVFAGVVWSSALTGRVAP
ncbi:type II secretion system F family protein [Prauserella shujinwangii]|nr:type II secretion system F family protein [Prauserella shujinwangii]